MYIKTYVLLLFVYVFTYVKICSNRNYVNSYNMNNFIMYIAILTQPVCLCISMYLTQL